MKRIATYSLIVVCLLYTYRAFLYAGIRKNRQGIYDKYNELFIKTNLSYNVLFLGSSRAEMHFSPQIFDSITSLNSYNMGIEGASVKLSFALLKIYRHQHQMPKYIVFNVDYFSLDNDTNRLINFPRYFPYLQNAYLMKELSQLDDRMNSFYYNPLHSLPYTQFNYLSASLHGWLTISGKYDTLMYKGFQTSFSNEFNDSKVKKPSLSFISDTNRHYLDSIILFSKKHAIHLVLVTTPVTESIRKQILNKGYLAKEMKDIANSHQIDYFDYSDSLAFDGIHFFSDANHLNLKGAKKFTESFSNVFNTIINQNSLLKVQP